MNTSKLMIEKLDFLLSENNIPVEILKDEEIRKLVFKTLMSEFESAATLAINIKIALGK